MPADEAACSSSSYQVRASQEGSDVASDPEYVRDVACLIIVQGLGGELVASVISIRRTHSKCRSSCMNDRVRRLLSVTRLCNKAGSVEVYRPTDERICREVGLVICTACVDGCLDGRGAIGNNVF